MQLVLEVHMQNIICKVEYISCLSIFLLISFLYILLQAICTTWLSFFSFVLTFFFLFCGIIMSSCADANPIYVLNIANLNLWHSWLRTLLKMTCSSSLPVSREIPWFWFQMKKETICHYEIYIHWIFIRDIVCSIVSLQMALINFFLWFCCGVFLLDFYTKNNLRERSDCNQMSILMMLFFVTRFGYS